MAVVVVVALVVGALMFKHRHTGHVEKQLADDINAPHPQQPHAVQLAAPVHNQAPQQEAQTQAQLDDVLTFLDTAPLPGTSGFERDVSV